MALFRKDKPLTRYWLKSNRLLVCEIAHFSWPIEKIAEFVEEMALAVGGRCAIFFYPFEAEDAESALSAKWIRCAVRSFDRSSGGPITRLTG